MKEKLIIKNFGPIKSVELELGRFNVLIGENATGKSIVAKILAVCRYFSYIRESQGILDTPFEHGLEEWGLSEFIQENSFINYKCDKYTFSANHSLIIENDPQTNQKSYTRHFETSLKAVSDDFKNLLVEYEKIKLKKTNSIINDEGFNFSVPTSFFQNDVAAVMDNPFYAPSERGLQSIFSIGKSSINNLSDRLFTQLARLNQIAVEFKNDTSIEPLDITYKNVNGHGYVKSKRHDFLSLFNAASGYQSTIPVVLLIKYYSELKKKPKAFIIEEPELNLFPVAQNNLIQYLADKTINYRNSMLLITHSPYSLTSVNNLIYAFKVGQKHKEEVLQIIPQKYWLNPDEVSAFRLLGDGTAKSIIDEELEEIAVEELDEAGRMVNAEYDSILSIKFDRNEKAERLPTLQ